MTADAISGSDSGSGPRPVPVSRPLRLAVLEADVPQPKTQAKFGSYGDIFTTLLTTAAKALSPSRAVAELVTITTHDIVNDLQSYPTLDDVDAVLITGSRHAAFDKDEWILKLVDYTKRAIDSGRVRVVGVCFGHQIIGRAMGADVGKNDNGWEVSVTEVDLTDKGKEIFHLDKLRIHQMHRDVVFNLPKDAISLGGNAICPVQSMYSPGRYLTLQGHPEFNEEIISEILPNRHAAGLIADELYTDGLKRAPALHDGIAIGQSFLQFFKSG